MKEGHPCDLLDRLAADPAFGLTRPELEALMDPQRYIGRCPQQVARFLERCQPLLAQAKPPTAPSPSETNPAILRLPQNRLSRKTPTSQSRTIPHAP